ncbi:carotenoid oxygenase [Acinetobacter silvestris]|uniref:Carotenoid oxygenase n=2 Tax=Acinetobacter silvestris TaxID=1977882 RepID=A0A1Y3CMF8_9GAMM|nr:carotenoid oxygenase [Acinetobacter silvestris]
MTPLKSKLNLFRQSIMQKGMHWLHRKPQHQGSNPYLEGVFAPVTEVEQFDLNVYGEIPPQLNGMLLRIGPNPIHVGNPSLYHWFVGDGMLHVLRIENGRAISFKSCFIETDVVQHTKQLPLKNGFRRGSNGVVNTNVVFHANKIWALIEAGTFPARLDLDLNTETHQFFNTDADLPFTAHPHKDNQTGYLHAICYDALDLRHAYYEVLDQDGYLIHFVKIPVKHGPMIHDCAITATDILIFDLPVTFSVAQLLKGSSLPYCWNDQHQARIGVLPKFGQANEIQWIDITPCFVFHAANAYRNEKNQIVVDLVVHQHMFKQSQQGPFEQQKAQLERWVIDLKALSIQRNVIDAQAQEFPRIDERYTGEMHRYIYTVSFDEKKMTAANQLRCHDVLEQRLTTYSFGEEWMTGEVIFIPESKLSLEGVGYLMSYVHHLDALPSKVVILKVHGTEMQLHAEIELGVRVPLGFHGNWVDFPQ